MDVHLPEIAPSRLLPDASRNNFHKRSQSVMDHTKTGSTFKSFHTPAKQMENNFMMSPVQSPK